MLMIAPEHMLTQAKRLSSNPLMTFTYHQIFYDLSRETLLPSQLKSPHAPYQVRYNAHFALPLIDTSSFLSRVFSSSRVFNGPI